MDKEGSREGIFTPSLSFWSDFDQALTSDPDHDALPAQVLFNPAFCRHIFDLRRSKKTS